MLTIKSGGKTSEPVSFHYLLNSSPYACSICHDQATEPKLEDAQGDEDEEDDDDGDNSRNEHKIRLVVTDDEGGTCTRSALDNEDYDDDSDTAAPTLSKASRANSLTLATHRIQQLKVETDDDESTDGHRHRDASQSSPVLPSNATLARDFPATLNDGNNIN